jgi:GNAT superfamily N-acetyltransferase
MNGGKPAPMLASACCRARPGSAPGRRRRAARVIEVLHELTPELRPLLAHKPGKWSWQIAQTCPEVETRFYVVRQAEGLVANVMVARRGLAGILGHVFTAPECRGNGYASALVAAALADFAQAGGEALFLATEAGSRPFQLYAAAGFAPTEPGSGHMAWYRDGEHAFTARAFAPAPARVEPFAYAHWPLLPALTCMNATPRVRLPGMGVVGRRTSESGSLDVLLDPERRATVAVSEHSGAVVAAAAVMPDPLFGEHVDVVDLFAAPGHENAFRPLLQALKLNRRRSQICYTDAEVALPAFQRVARLASHLLYGNVDLWQRPADRD